MQLPLSSSGQPLLDRRRLRRRLPGGCAAVLRDQLLAGAARKDPRGRRAPRHSVLQRAFAAVFEPEGHRGLS